MFVLIGIQDCDDPYHPPYMTALAVSKDQEKLERYRVWYQTHGDTRHDEFRIENILNLDKEA